MINCRKAIWAHNLRSFHTVASSGGACFYVHVVSYLSRDICSEPTIILVIKEYSAFQNIKKSYKISKYFCLNGMLR